MAGCCFRWRPGLQPDGVAVFNYCGRHLNDSDIVLAISHLVCLGQYWLQQRHIDRRRFPIDLDDLRGGGVQRGGLRQYRKRISVRYNCRCASGSGGGER